MAELQERVDALRESKGEVAVFDAIEFKTGLNSIPCRIFPQIPQLKELFLTGHTELTELPDEISVLTKLQSAWLNDNGLRNLPKDFGKLKNLRELWLHENQLNRIPSSIFALEFLEELRMDDNNISVIPPAISSLRNLKILRLDNTRIRSTGRNRITSVPEEIGQMVSLRQLHLQGNRIRTVPASMAKLKNLEELRLEDNRITFIPLEFVELLSHLKVITLKNNPILNLPEKLISKSEPSRIMEFLQDLQEGEENCFQMKLMIVGEENVGKTSLVKSLKNPKKGSSGKNVSTDGIDIQHFTTKMIKKPKLESTPSSPSLSKSSSRDSISSLMGSPNPRKPEKKPEKENHKIEWTVWDFAGQEVYYVTHQFFLTNRGVYLLVFNLNAAEDSGKLEYWLQSVKARTLDAPVILVATHMDEFKGTENDLYEFKKATFVKYAERFPNLQAIIEVDARKGKNVDVLIKCLSEIASNLPRMGERVPKTYTLLDEAIFKERKIREKSKLPPVVTWNAFEELSEKCSVSKEVLPRATKFLHELGTILHFSDPTVGLDGLVFLDPRFMVNLLATMVSTKVGFFSNGVLQHKHLGLLWKEYPQNLYPQFIALFQKFEISIQLYEPGKARSGNSTFNNGKSLFPHFLDETNAFFPKLKPLKHTETVFGRIYHLGFMPIGLFGRLIVRLIGFTQCQDDWQLFYAKSRIFMMRGSDYADIHLSHLTRRIVATVVGKKPIRLLRVITENIEGLLEDWFPHLNFEIFVACPHCLKHILNLKEVSEVELLPEVEEFPLKILEEAVQSGRKDVICSKSNLNEIGVLRHSNSADLQLKRDVSGDSIFKSKSLSTKKLSRHVSNILEISLKSPDSQSSWNTEEPKSGTSILVSTLVPDLTLSHVTKIPWENLEVSEKIGRGSFAMVFRGKLNENSVAVKKYQFSEEAMEDGDNPFLEFRREVTLMSQLEHVNIVKLIGVCLEPVSMVTEFMGAGDLSKFLKNNSGKMPFSLQVAMALDMALGMEYLHTLTPPIIHRDLKSPNVLVTDSNNPEGRPIAKIADLGLSRHLPTDMGARKVDNPRWLAPECMMFKPYNEKADVYSFGIVMWELLTSEPPFDEFNIAFSSQLEDEIIAGKRPTLPKAHQNNTYGQLYRACVEGDMWLRPSFTEIVAKLKSIATVEAPTTRVALKDMSSPSAYDIQIQ